MGFFDRWFGERFLGWTAGRQVHLVKSGTLVSDPGYKLVFVLFPLAANGVIECDCSDVALQLKSGDVVTSVGVAISLDANFRCQPGQKCPAVLPAKTISWRQDDGSHYAHVFSVKESDVPAVLMVRGKAHPLGDALPAVPSGLPGGPEKSKGQALAGISLAVSVPFTFRCEVPGTTTTYGAPAGQGDGIVAVWQSSQFNVVVARLPPSLLDHGRLVGGEGISVRQLNGASAPILGAILRINDQPTPYGLADRFQLGLGTARLPGGGTLKFLYDYQGPFSALLPQDCKLALAIGPEVGWQEVGGLSMPGYESRIRDGTVLMGGPT